MRARHRPEAGKSMSYRFRHRIIGPLVLFWLALTVASLVLGALALARLSRSIGASPEAAAVTRREMNWVRQTTWVTGLLGIGAGLLAVYLYRVDNRQDRAQKELLDQKLQAEEVVKEKSAFLANMSHEIRSPMNAILGFSELLEPEGLTPKQSQYVRAIRDSGASLLQTINDILDLSKLEADRVELHPGPTDMRDSCEFLRTVFAQQAVKKSLQLQFDLSPDLPRALLLDRIRLRQVLVNLLGNALKFTERGSVKTKVSWQKEENSSTGTLMIDVEDSGLGIPPDKLDDIFRPFVQAHSRLAVDNQGTGIGLTIVKRLTEIMNGTLTVESKVGQGSVFHLRLTEVPVSVRLPVDDHAEPGGAVDFNDFQPATLLVVDDNEVNRDLMTSMFEKTHHRVCTTRNGQEALDWLGKSEADVVLLDLRMPVMDGQTALAEIRKRPGLASLPVIAVTASSPVGDGMPLNSDFSEYIRKPFSRQTLFRALARFLQQERRKERSDPAAERLALNIPPPERAGHWQALALELRTLAAGEWIALSESLAINDTQTFAAALQKLGQAGQCALLTSYAATLAELAQSYAIGQLEEHLSKFPSLIESI